MSVQRKESVARPSTRRSQTQVRNIDEILAERLSPARLAKVQKRADAILEKMRLDQLRQDRKFTQAALAAAMKIQQGEVSRIEKRDEIKLGTLRDYVSSLGGKLELRAVFPDKSVQLAIAGK